MKIKHVRTWKENLELTKPYTIAYETIDQVENVFVVIEADNGLTGIGSASPSPEVTGETLEFCQQSIEQHLESLLLGMDLREFKSLLAKFHTTLEKAPAAMAAVDIALHDLLAKTLDRPLVSLLGQVHKGLPTSVTIGILPVSETLREAREFVGQGFTTLKVKTGLDVEEDIERISRLREDLGPDITIRVDANQGYNADQYRRFYEQTRLLHVELVEQPLKAAEIKTMQNLPEQLRRLAAADESLLAPSSVIPCLAEPFPFGIFNIKLMKCGGVAPALDIAQMAQHAGIELMWGCNDESIVSITAALHAALACKATSYLDLDGSFDLARDVVKGGFMLKNGWLYPGEGPGLGVTFI